MLQNLLSERQKKHVRINYYMRLATVVAFLLAGSFLVGLITLLPSYLKVLSELNYGKETLTLRQEEAEDAKNFSKEISETVEVIALLEKEEQKETLTTFIDELLKERPEGISLRGYSYDRKRNTIRILGFASTRDIVAPYARSLEENPLFVEAPVPISDLARNRDLEFSMQVSIEKQNNHDKD